MNVTHPAALLLALALATSTTEEPGDPASTPDTPVAEVDRPVGGVRPSLRGPMATRPAPSLLTRSRAQPFDLFLGLWQAGPSRPTLARSAIALDLTPRTRSATPMERIVYGADRGAFAGLALGTLGSWGGLWEEKQAWKLMGLGAALGATLGTLGDNVRVTVRSDSPDR